MQWQTLLCKHATLVVIPLLASAAVATELSDQIPCAAVKFGQDSVVCVCNSSYCDTAPRLPDVAAPFVSVITSTQAGERLSVSRLRWTAAEFSPHTSSRTGNFLHPTDAWLNVSSTSMRQTVVGFGGAVTDAAGININKLPLAAQQRLISSYYSINGGIGYSMARVPIGGCDFSTRPYTYADSANDTDLRHFALAPEDFQYKLPILKRAIRLNKSLKVIGSPWSAPAWMKTNGKLTGKGYLKRQFYKTWADYLVKFVSSYSKNGVPIWALTTQNEPLDGLIPNFWFNSMAWNPGDQAVWVRKHLAPAMNRISNRTSSDRVKLFVMDDQRFELPFWVDNFFSDSEATNAVDGIALHWYYDEIYPSAVLDETNSRLPHKMLINTEACEGSMPWQLEKVALGSWRRAETYASSIIDDLNHWVTGWIDWNLALDMNGGPNWVSNFVDSPIIVDSELRQFYKQPMFYAMAHFAMSLTPDSNILHLNKLRGSHVLDGVMAVMAKTPAGYLVLTLLNTNQHAVRITLISSSNGVLPLSVKPKSITTLRWKETR